MTTQPLHGIINGKTIELAVDPGVPAGQVVEVIVRMVPAVAPTWGEGLRKSAGALANDWTEEDDRILEEIYQQRKVDRRREVDE